MNQWLIGNECAYSVESRQSVRIDVNRLPCHCSSVDWSLVFSATEQRTIGSQSANRSNRRRWLTSDARDRHFFCWPVDSCLGRLCKYGFADRAERSFYRKVYASDIPVWQIRSYCAWSGAQFINHLFAGERALVCVAHVKGTTSAPCDQGNPQIVAESLRRHMAK